MAAPTIDARPIFDALRLIETPFPTIESSTMRSNFNVTPYVTGSAVASVAFGFGLVCHRWLLEAKPSDWMAFSGPFIGTGLAVLGSLAVVDYTNSRAHRAKIALVSASIDRPAKAAEKLVSLLGSRGKISAYQFKEFTGEIIEFHENVEQIKAHIDIDTIALVKTFASISIAKEMLAQFIDATEEINKIPYQHTPLKDQTDFEELERSNKPLYELYSQSLVKVAGCLINASARLHGG